MKNKLLFFLGLLLLNLSILGTNAAKLPYLPNTDFSYSVWVPYWARWAGVDELYANITSNGAMIYNSNFAATTSNAGFYSATNTLMNLDKMDIVSPFTFEVDETGAFQDKGKMNEDAFASLIKIAQAKGKKVYPTVLWANGDQINKVLKDKDLQYAIYSDVIYHVNKYNLDGIDIDFEGKKAESKDDFNYLLKLLSNNLHTRNKGLICTIEPRIPLENNYSILTEGTRNNIERANDYSSIAKYCDQVRVMIYDQMGADMTLNNKNKDKLYRPVADIAWVESVIKNTIKEGIPTSKMILGVATYGYKFEVLNNNPTLINTNSPDKYGSILLNNLSIYKYNRIGSMNYFYANDLAKNLGINPIRNTGGELEFSYSTSTDLSNTTPGIMKTYYVEYSDSEAIAQKIELAKKYKLAGIAIFKIDGNNDHNIWNILKRQNINNDSNNSQNNNCYIFNKNFNIGNKDNDVLKLQKLLNKEGFVIASFGAGSQGNETNMYGRATSNAVKKLQEKFKSEILTPWGLKNGTGYFGEATRKYLNNNFCIN